jgi:ParB/RepB/Spo0J family partition protein
VAKKRTSLSQTLFSGIDPFGQDAPGENGGRLLLLPVTAVQPDPDQPRRLLPADLEAQLRQTRPYDPLTIMRQWLEREAEGDQRLADLRHLADSIAQHGLINPITVRPSPTPDENGPHHWIITGERRYWSHILLAAEGRQIAVGEADPQQIQALLAAEGVSIRAHQLIENINREDINALEKAQGLVALRHELSHVNDSSPAAGGDTEVNDSSPQLVPWTQVSEALGISPRYRIYLTGVLELAPEAQAIIAAHNLAEMTIRPIVQKLKERPDLQVEALQQLVAWQRENEAEDGPNRPITKLAQDLVNRLLAREKKEGGAAVYRPAAHTRKLRQTFRRALHFLHDLPDEERVLVARDLALDKQFKPALAELEALHEQIDDLLGQVKRYQEEG